ncbi:hypothetical protein BBJ66_30885 [Rhizobium sp. RSm-3]|nr:hypothetical protein BBJ66_30885 [Rhizobium sp. RSm-3]
MTKQRARILQILLICLQLLFCFDCDRPQSLRQRQLIRVWTAKRVTEIINPWSVAIALLP